MSVPEFSQDIVNRSKICVKNQETTRGPRQFNKNQKGGINV